MRRRWLSAAAIAAAVSIAAASGTFFALVGVTGDDIVRAAVAQSKSLADLLDARSPGARTQAELTKTKHARAMPKQRTAPRHAHTPPKPDMAEVAQLLAPPGPQPVSIASSAPFLIGPPPSLAMIVGSLPGADEVIPPGGGGATPPGGGPPLVTVPTPQPREPVPPPALPEPSTWASMLLGFGFIGWRIRRRSGARTSRRARVA